MLEGFLRKKCHLIFLYLFYNELIFRYPVQQLPAEPVSPSLSHAPVDFRLSPMSSSQNIQKTDFSRLGEDTRKRRVREDVEGKKRKMKMKKKETEEDMTSPVSGTFIRRLSDVDVEIKKG